MAAGSRGLTRRRLAPVAPLVFCFGWHGIDDAVGFVSRNQHAGIGLAAGISERTIEAAGRAALLRGGRRPLPGSLTRRRHPPCIPLHGGRADYLASVRTRERWYPPPHRSAKADGSWAARRGPGLDQAAQTVCSCAPVRCDATGAGAPWWRRRGGRRAPG